MIAVTSCQEDISNECLPVKSETFDASIEIFESLTKTSMTPTRNVVWSSDDQLAIFQGNTLADKYQVSESSVGSPNGSFSLVSDNSGELNADFVSGNQIDANIALYPYSENMVCSNAVVSDSENSSSVSVYEITGVVLPSVQGYVAGSFGEGTFPMVAVTETMSDHKLKFKNLMGALRLQFKGSQKVVSIKVEGKNNESLSGTATITAYTNNNNPAITMTSETVSSVTLDCGDGVQLDPSVATDFIVALPPVLFSQGFKVTVVDSDEVETIIESDVANTVLRSSILTMPVVSLDDSQDEETDDATYIEYLFLNKISLTMYPSTSYLLETDIDPIDVTDPTLTWSSSDNTIASVDANGKVTAKIDGTATITVVAVGGVSATCSVTVKSATSVAVKNYIVDGHDYGPGVKIGQTIWAPVNCGYEPATADYKGYPYGKLYQWGRKYGQGYDDNDATYPSGDNLVEGPVKPSWGSSDAYADKFFYHSKDWCENQIDDLWIDSEGNKTTKDPCPDGWRVPTFDELSSVSSNHSLWTKNSIDQNGYSFTGEYTYMEGIPQVFFPAAGYRDNDCSCDSRDGSGHYWSSLPSTNSRACEFFFDRKDFLYMDKYYRVYGYSVRCVQE